MPYDNLPEMQKTLVKWKHAVKYGYELKQFEVKEPPNKPVIITVSNKISIIKVTQTNVTIPNRIFTTTHQAMTDMQDSDENKRLQIFLDEFDTAIYEQVALIPDNDYQGGFIK